MRPLALVLLLLSLPLAGCFSPDEPPCSFVCGDNKSCPDDYACGGDGYCHLAGQTAVCGFSDAAMIHPDLAVKDSSARDLNSADLTPPPSDL